MYANVNSLAFEVVFVLLSFCFLCVTVKRSKDGCIVCGKKSQNIPFLQPHIFTIWRLVSVLITQLMCTLETSVKGVEELYKNTEATGRPSLTLVLPATFLFFRKHFTTLRIN